MNRSGTNISAPAALPTLGRAVMTGAVGFGLASLCVFATVAFGERWMYDRLRLTGAYIVWTSLFIMLGGTALRPIVASGSAGRFYLLFALGFFVYAVGWIGAYFTLRGAAGEWAGSLVGSVLMALVFAAGFHVPRSTMRLAAVLFIANSVGYFVGSFVNSAVGAKTGMLLWGGIYGLCLGGGLGAVLQIAQKTATITVYPKQDSR